jgi:hypothetical protein
VNASDSINIGGIIFGTGSYSNITSNPYAEAVANGRIGIGTTAPNATLDVSGSTIITGSLTVGNGTNTNLDPYGFVYGSGSYLSGSNSNSAILGGTFNKIHTSANQGIGNVILGGNLNMITGSNQGIGYGHQYSAIIGGELNSIDSNYPGSGEMIAASYSSSIGDSYSSAIIASKASNIFYNFQTPEAVAIIASQYSEIASTQNAAIIGGDANKLEKLTYNSVILGGQRNLITDSVQNSAVIGGSDNLKGSTANSVILGGTFNKIDTDGTRNVILGGTNNTITGSGVNGGHFDSAIIGGRLNTIHTGTEAQGELIAASDSSSITDSTFSAIIASRYATIVGTEGDTRSTAIIASDYSSMSNNVNLNASIRSAIIGGEYHSIDGAVQCAIIGGRLNHLPDNITNSVILGGSFISGSKDDTVYMPNAHVTGSFESPAGNTIDSNALIQAGLLYLSNNF